MAARPPQGRLPPMHANKGAQLAGSNDETEEMEQMTTDTAQLDVPGKLDKRTYLTPNDFVEAKFKMRQCNALIRNDKTKKCGCNNDDRWHEKMHIRIPEGNPGPWQPKLHTDVEKTNAHGKLKLHGYGRLRAGEKPKYIRTCALETDYEDLWTLLTEHWEVPKPQIILSINGGAKKMAPMTLRLKVALKKGLMSVSACAKTWFITPGFNLGVSKLVGEAVRDFSLANTAGTQIVAIGMATWGAVYNRHQLEDSTQENASTDMMHVADYYNSKENPGKGQAVLDPHHTHFILCDDGTQKKFNSEVAFRAKFETFVSAKMKNISSTSCSPVVQVVIEGGKQTIKTAYEALREGTPVVFIKGSGRCADLVCDLLSSPLERLDKQISEQLQPYKSSWSLDDKEMKSLSEKLKAMCKELRYLVHSFNVDASEQLDRAILLAILKSSSNMTTDGQLALAMSMNRCDLAAQEIFSDENKGTWQHLDLDNCMLEALKRGQTEFVELFLDHGISIENFLNTDRIKELYLSAIRAQHPSREAEELRELIENVKTPFYYPLMRLCRTSVGQKDLDDSIMYFVGRLVQMFTGDSMPNLYAPADEVTVKHTTNFTVDPVTQSSNRATSEVPLTAILDPSKKPPFIHRETGKKGKVYPSFPPRSGTGKRLYTEQDLFLWSIFLNRIDLAKVFWRLGKDHIGSALVASAIFGQLQARAEKDGELELSDSLKQNCDYFEEVATGILSVAYQQDKDRAHLLLIRGLPYWGNETLLSLADQNECMIFMSHTAVQTKLSRIWMGGMSPYVSEWKIFLNLLFSFLFIRLIFPVRELENPTSNDNRDLCKRRSHLTSEEVPFPSTTRVQPMTDHSIMNPEVIDPSAPNTRELRETVSAQQASVNLPPHARRTFLDDFRFRQQHAWKRVAYLKAIYLFYTAPFTKFLLNAIFYLLFVLIFGYFVLVELRPFSDFTKRNVTCSGVRTTSTCTQSIEIIAYFWFFSFIVEEMRQALMRDQRSMRYKLYDWFSSGWNKFDLVLYLTFITSLILRYTLPDSQFVVIRTLFALVLAMLMLRFMQVYYAHRNIGPQVVMITKMVNDIIFFLAIFLVFLLAYGSAAQALLYPNDPLSMELIKKIVFYPYWQVFGELTLEVVQGKEAGQTPNAIVVVLFAIYMLFTNVLLLNLLIAMFGYTFENVHGSANQIWAYNRYDLINEYFDRPFLVPPFIIFTIIYRVCVNLVDRCRGKCCNMPEQKPSSDFKVILDLSENQMMSAFEQQCMERYMTQQQFTSHQKSESRAESSKETKDESVDEFIEQVTILREMLDKKSRSEAASEGLLTPRGGGEENPLGAEVTRIQAKLKGLEEKLQSQANVLENIFGVLNDALSR